MNPALSERLQLARRRLFVGRTTELRDWSAALDAPTWSVPIWHIHGLGGIGKTSLLREWRSEARERGVVVLPLDARDFDPTIDAICGALRELLNALPGNELPTTAGPAEICAAMDAIDGRLVVQIDTFELLEPLDDWLRESFLPQLPSNVAVNIAGRNHLSMAWRGDAGWHDLLRSFDLGALSPNESTDYLERRGVASRAQANLRSWAHGHPLALSLAADIWLQRPDEVRLDLQEAPEPNSTSFQPGEVPQLVGSLLGHLISEVPTRWHRAALEACATVSVLSEELLGELLAPLNGQGEAPDSRSLFEWLRSLSIIQANRFGLFPHDLAREVLVADLRWRNPQWHAQLHKGARQFYLRHIHHSSGGEQQRAIFDCLFLHRMSPAVAPYLQWNDSRSSLEPGRGADIEACLEWVEQHEGQQSRHIASRWFASQPENLTVVRNPGGQPQGFVFQLALHNATPAEIESDPAASAAWSYLQKHAPLRPGERSTLFRFWMDKDEYQNVGATQSLIFVQAARHYLTTPQLAFTFFPCAAPEFWSLGFGYADLEWVKAADFEVEGHHYGTFCHDWRSRPVLAWIDLLTQREMHSVAIESTPVPEPAKEATFLVLDEASFNTAVRQALRGWSDPAALRSNPLLKTSLVQRRARQLTGQGKQPSSDETLLALRSLLRQAVVALATAPRQDKSYRALELTYGKRSLSQEGAADVMNVSHSSFRRYLRSALDSISGSLWQREMAPLDSGTDFSSDAAENEHHLTLF
jgi:hypothetical protein